MFNQFNLILVEPSFFQKNTTAEPQNWCVVLFKMTSHPFRCVWKWGLLPGYLGHSNDERSHTRGSVENPMRVVENWVMKTGIFRSARVLIHCSLVVYVTVKSTLVSKKHHLSVTYPLFQWLITAIKPQSFHQIQSHWCQRTIIYQYLSVIYPHFQWFQWLWNPIKP